MQLMGVQWKPEEPEDSLLEVLVALAEEADAEIPDDTNAETSADV